MKRNPLYLRTNIAVEPLVSQWYAWSYLVAPSTAPLYIANQHLKVMQSFVAQPEIHIAAAKNPELAGGPYIHYGIDRVKDIRALIDRTSRERATLIEFAAAVKALDIMLNEHPKGMSLEELYPKVPNALRGYVELCYDPKNQPTFRFIEGLLYRSPYHDETAQSLLLWRIDADDRPFIYSTPRLEEPCSIHLRTPFRHPIVDELVKLRRRPAPFDHVKEILGLSGGDEDLLHSFLTEQPPPPSPPHYNGNGVRIRYLGHACVLLESMGVTILTDPMLSYSYPTELARLTYQHLPDKIDYVLITHAHADHLVPETLLQLRSRIGTVVVPKNNDSLQDPSIRLMLKHMGFRNVIEISELDEIEVEGGTITGLPFLGEHGDLDIRSKLAYLVRLKGRTAVIAADSNALEPLVYKHIRATIGPVDVLFLGMECVGAPMSWTYGPLMLTPLMRKMDQSRRLNGSNCRRAGEIIDLLEPGQVYIYAMGQEPWLGHVMGLRYTDSSPQILESNELIARCRAKGISAERPYCTAEIVLGSSS